MMKDLDMLSMNADTVIERFTGDKQLKYRNHILYPMPCYAKDLTHRNSILCGVAGQQKQSQGHQDVAWIPRRRKIKILIDIE